MPVLCQRFFTTNGSANHAPDHPASRRSLRCARRRANKRANQSVKRSAFHPAPHPLSPSVIHQEPFPGLPSFHRQLAVAHSQPCHTSPSPLPRPSPPPPPLLQRTDHQWPLSFFMKMQPRFEQLEARQLLNAAFDYIGLTQLRADPTYAGLDGTGVTVAVLDTGLDSSHVRLRGNYLAGRNIVDGTDTPTDRQSHGTHVAGIVASTDPEIGVATDAKLVGVKVLDDDGGGSTTDIRSGLRWVYDNRERYNIKVVNMSLGGGFFTSINQVGGDIVLTEVRRLEAAGITVVSAGGNSFKNNEYQNFASPGIYSTLVVGAQWKDSTASRVSWGSGAIDFTTGAGRITSFSQRLVASNTIFAPGAFIRSTVPGNRFDEMGGTSQASPIVAGAVAVLQEAAQRFGGRYLSPAEVRDIVISTAVTVFDGDDEDDNVRNTQVNYRRLDIYAAVQEVRSRLQGTAPAPTPDPEGTPTSADANGVIAGAFLLNPSLDGSETLSVRGSVGTDAAGTVNVGPADVDIYKFTTVSKGVVTIRLAASSSNPQNFDSYLRLLNGQGQQIAADDNSAGNGFSLLSLQLEAGTYYAALSGKGNETYDPAGAAGRTPGATGTYSATFSLSNEDPNGLFAGSVAVNFGTDLEPTRFAGLIGRDYGNLVGRSDVDMFKVVGPDNGLLIVDIDSSDTSGYVDSYLRIFDEQGNQVAFDDDSTAPDEVNDSGLVYDISTGARVGHFTDSYKVFAIERGKTYYIGISDFDNRTYNPNSLDDRSAVGAGGTYEISLSFASVDTDGTISLVRTDSPLAFPFSSIQGVIGSDIQPEIVTDVGNKDIDFYRIRVTKSFLLQVTANATSNGATGESLFDPVLSLYDLAGNLLASNDDFTGTDPTLQFVIAANTEYFIAVTGFGNENFDPFAAGSGSPGDTGSYTLVGSLFNPSQVKTISDNALSFQRIQTLSSGVSVRGILGTDNGFNSGATDVDLYKFVAPSDGILTARSEGIEAFSADTNLRIFDSGGRELAFNDNQSDETRGSLAAAALKRGKSYFIGVNGSSSNPRAYDPKKFGTGIAGSTGSYELAVTFNGPPTLTSVATLTTADAGQPFTISYETLAAAANEADPEGASVAFSMTRLSSGSLTKNGLPVVANQTTLAPGETWIWTPAANANGNTRAFTIQASDGIQRSAKAVQVTIATNAPPTLSRVSDFRAPRGTTELTFDYATFLRAANESDRNKDLVQFRIETIIGGELLINGAAAIAGSSIILPGNSLLFRPPAGSTPNSKIPAFTVRAFDGRLFSSTPITVFFIFP